MLHEWFNIISEWTTVTLLNGVWSGALLIAFLWLGVKITSTFKPINASTRYLVWVTGLILCTALMAWQGTRSAPENFAHSVDLVEVNYESGNEAQIEPVFSSTFPTIERTPALTDNYTEAVAESPETVSIPVGEQENRWYAGLLPEANYSFSVQAPPLLVSQIIMVIWGFVTLVLLSQLLLSGILVYRLKREAKKAPEMVSGLANRWLRTTKSARKVEVGISSQIKTAVAVGYLHPMVLIPERMLVALDNDEIEQVVLHELSHIRRFDDWTILLQQVLKAVFFFHPGVWALSRLMNQDREIACDDQVVSLSKSPKAYANCLAKVASLRISGYAPIAVAPATSSKKELFIRVRSILNRKLSDSYRASRLVYGMLFLVALGVCLSITYLAPVVAFADVNEVPVVTLSSTEPVTFSPEPGLDRIEVQSPILIQDDNIESEIDKDIDPDSTKILIVSGERSAMKLMSEAPSMAPVVLDVGVHGQHAPIVLGEGVKGQRSPVVITRGEAVDAESEGTSRIETSAIILPTPVRQANSLSAKSMIRWLHAVKRISSPGEKRALLKKASRQLPVSDAVYNAYIEAAMSISTPSDKSESLLNLLIRSDLGEDATLNFLEAIRLMTSSNDRYGLMLSFFVEEERLLIKDERIQRAARSVIESVNTDTRQTALKVLHERTLQELNDKE